MWIQKVFIFIVLCTRHSDSFDVESKAAKESDLSLITNDLAKLSRIVNAIALQSAAIRKSVPVREVITELLQVHNDSFSIVVRNDLKAGFGDLQSMDELLKGISDELQIKENFFNDVEKVNKVLTSALGISEFSQGLDVPLKEFFEYLKTVNVRACDEDTLQKAVSFHTWINKRQGDSMKIINSLKEIVPKLKTCMKSIKNYQKVRDEFGTKYSPLSLLILIRNNIESIREDVDSLNRFKGYIQQVKDISVALEAALKTWKKSDVGEMLQRGIQPLDTIANLKYASTSHSLTAGFAEVEDLQKVFDDLNSDWFKAKISKGKSTEKLEKSLRGFKAFGEKMEELKKKWAEFQEEYPKARQHLNITAVRLIVAEDRSIVVKEATLKEFAKTFKECHEDFGLGDQQNFTEFDNGKKAFVKMSRLVDSIHNRTKETVSTIDPEVLKPFLEAFEKLKTTGKTADIVISEMEQLGGYSVFQRFVAILEKLQDDQGKIGGVFDPNIDPSKKAIEDSYGNITGSKLSKFLSCLDGKSLNMAEWKKALEYVQPVLDRNHLEPTEKLFNKFLAMRTKLVDVEKHLKAMGKEADDEDPVLKLERSKEVSISFSRGVRMLMEMAEAYEKRQDLQRAKQYHADVLKTIQKSNTNDFVRRFWKNPAEPIDKLLGELKRLDRVAGALKDGEFVKMKQIFLKAKLVEGFPEVFGQVSQQLEKEGYTDTQKLEDLENARELSSLDLDFSVHRGYFPAASLSVGNIKTYFDDVFDHHGKKKRIENAFALVFGISFAILIVIVLLIAGGYGLTESGRERYRKLYWYYFPKPKEFEKRWRYALFMDRVDGKNALLDGVREIHKEHVLKALKRGVYINVYANFPPELGNTALHLATKRAYPEIVDILIRYGADRTLLNAQNKTPEQMIPADYRETQKEKIARFQQVEKIYKKYRKKKFRIQVPDVFPDTSFHIFIDGKTDDDLTIAFTERFQAICSEEMLPTTTHCVVKTDKTGLLETDDLKLLFWILSGAIIVKDSWMTECLKNEYCINHDAEYLVEKVKFNGVVYDTVIQWTMAMAKGTMPYLYGVYVAVVIVGYENIALLSNIITLHGGVVVDKFPEKEEYNLGSRPYLHVNTSPLFIIHDGKVNLDYYKNDIDKMYTLFTEAEFLHFMLKRDIQVNQNPNPPPVAIDGLID